MQDAMPAWRTPPNLLTYSRMALTPVIALAVLRGDAKAALSLVALAAFTDGIDGFLARRFGWETTLGAYLDPIADKLLLVTLYVVFAATDILPMWLVSVVILRDLWILSMVAYAWFATTVRDFPPRWSGKASTAVQLLLAGTVLIQNAFPGHIAPAIVAVLVFLVTCLAGISGVDYTIVAIRRYTAWRARQVPGAIHTQSGQS